MKPFIGITTSLVRGHVANDQNYSDSIVKAGGIPILIPPLHDVRYIEDILKRIKGLILSGGQDISPFLYQQDPHPACGEFSLRRDRFEVALYERARAMEMPILAICRGMQLVNVIHGGNLVQDIAAQRPESLVHVHPQFGITSHRLTTLADTTLEELLGAEAIVNSIHHQAIDEVGEGLVISARSADGTIEGLETDHVLAVQFHPERLHQDPLFLKFFINLVGRAK